MGNVPRVERFEGGVAERALQIAPYARHVTQILRLAVAHVETRENAEDLAGALRRQGYVDLDELGGVELGVALAAPAHIAAEQRKLELFRHVDAGVLQQGGQIVGGRAHYRILEV